MNEPTDLTESNTTSPTSLRSPICSQLRSKKYYFLGRAPLESAELLDASNDCWCAVTHDRVGPDLDGVHPDDCRASRTCFRSLYAGGTPDPT